MDQLIPVLTRSDIIPEYQQTPIGMLLEFHNLNRPFENFEKASLLIGMCMDYRKHLNIPNNFAYIIRSGGANLRYSEFNVSFAISVGQIRHIALIGHNHCGMVNLYSRKEAFIKGLVDIAGWERQWAEEHFMHFSPMFEIGNEIDFLLSESKRLRSRYPKITIVPMYYKIEDNRLYLIRENMV